MIWRTPTQPASYRHALWLVPADQAPLDALIQELAQAHQGPRFDAHITLLGGLMGRGAELAKQLAPFVASHEPINLKARQLKMGASYMRSFYLAFDESTALNTLREQLVDLFGMNDLPPFEPHLSLYYGNATPAQKTAMGEHIHKRIPTSILFSQLWLVQTAVAVPDWCLIARMTLGESVIDQ